MIAHIIIFTITIGLGYYANASYYEIGGFCVIFSMLYSDDSRIKNIVSYCDKIEDLYGVNKKWGAKPLDSDSEPPD